MSDSIGTRPDSTFRLRRRTPGSFVMVPCPKIGRSLRCQGQLERALAIVLAGCPVARQIQEQPMKIWYGWNESRQGTQIRLLEQEPKTRRDRTTGERYSYVVPDFLVSMLDGTYLLIEVKPSRKLATEVVQRKLAVAATLAANREWSFHVVTERELFRTPLVRNLSFVARYRLFAENPAISAQLLHQVTEEGIQFGKLIGNSSCELLSSEQHALHLLASEQLSFDPVLQELTNSSRVYPKSVISWDPFDLAWASSFYSMDGPIVWSANSPTTATLPKTQNST